MPADIALGQRAVDRVAQRVDADIGVGVARQALVVRHRHAAQQQRTARFQDMHIEAGADARDQGGRVNGAAMMRSSRTRSSG